MKPDRPICEACDGEAELRVNGQFVCIKHADLASEADDNEVLYLNEKGEVP